jgi:RNase adaptor protein for sRNA GlmZ degradation
MTDEQLHPFLPSMTELTADELDKKHVALLNRWRMARSMHMHPDVLNQLNILLTGIEDEKYRRAQVEESTNNIVIDTDPIEIPVFNRKK